MDEYEPSVSFPPPKDVGPRDWGHEVLLDLAPGLYSMKLITMKAGKKGGFQYHRKKHESGIVTSGNLKVYYKNDKGDRTFRFCTVGDVFSFPPGARHQVEAVTNCSYIECSNPVFNDRVHAEREVGLEKEDGGLPSTNPWEIELR